MTTAQSRISVLDNPVLAPGTCILCGCAGDGERKFLDFGKVVDWIGAIYFCTVCIVEVAEASGYVPSKSFDALHDAYRELQVKNDQLVAKYEPFEKAINDVVGSRTSMPDLDFDNLRARLPELEDTDHERANDESDSSGESETRERDNVEGLDDLLDDADLDPE